MYSGLKRMCLTASLDSTGTLLIVVGALQKTYDLFLLPSRFLKFDGLIFISANSMECSWPFQWNQLTP